MNFIRNCEELSSFSDIMLEDERTRHTYFKHIKIALFRFSDILLKPDVQQNFASELSQNLVRTWSELGNAAEHSRTYHALS